MADQRRWFKVWTSVVSDDDFDPSRPTGLIGLGRFSILGAYTALHGEKGSVEIMPDTLFRITQAHNLDELRCDLALKNVAFEEGKNRHGKITVTWNKWTKYQEDSTQAERAKTSRSKKRREEKREEEKREEENSDSAFDSFYASYPNKKSPEAARKAWAKLNPDQDLADKIIAAVEAQKEWRRRRPAGAFTPEWKHPATWLNKECWKDELESGPANGGNQGGFLG